MTLILFTRLASKVNLMPPNFAALQFGKFLKNGRDAYPLKLFILAMIKVKFITSKKKIVKTSCFQKFHVYLLD